MLDRNYRSAARIVAAAKRLIVNNRARRDKEYQPLTASRRDCHPRLWDGGDRGAAGGERRGQSAQAASPQQIAVLYRAGTIGLALQPALKELRIPYEVRGAGDLWQGVAARLVVGSLYYLRDGESVECHEPHGKQQACGDHPS